MPAVAAVASVGFGGVAAATALTGGSGQATAGPLRRPALATPDSPPAPHVSATGTAARPPSTTHVAAVQIRRPVLVVAAGRLSWVEVIAPAHHLLFRGMLRPGQTLSYGAHPLSLLLSDTGAVRVTVRGQARQLTGRPGQLFILHIS